MFNGVEKDYPSPTEKLARKESLKVHVTSSFVKQLTQTFNIYDVYFFILKWVKFGQFWNIMIIYSFMLQFSN